MTQAIRKEYELSKEDLSSIYEASKPVPYLVANGVGPTSPQENANAVWMRIGEKMGFEYMTVRPVSGKGPEFITAVELKGA